MYLSMWMLWGHPRLAQGILTEKIFLCQIPHPAMIFYCQKPILNDLISTICNIRMESIVVRIHCMVTQTHVRMLRGMWGTSPTHEFTLTNTHLICEYYIILNMERKRKRKGKVPYLSSVRGFRSKLVFNLAEQPTLL